MTASHRSNPLFPAAHYPFVSQPEQSDRTPLGGRSVHSSSSSVTASSFSVRLSNAISLLTGQSLKTSSSARLTVRLPQSAVEQQLHGGVQGLQSATHAYYCVMMKI